MSWIPLCRPTIHRWHRQSLLLLHFISQCYFKGSRCMLVLLFQLWETCCLLQLPSLSTPNINLFYIKFIPGNIRLCQGCRTLLRCADGSVLAPPFDLCVARAEYRSFWDATGILRTPQKEQPAHYHLNISCIRVVATDFVPSTIVVPPDVLLSLGQVHKEFLRIVFGLVTWYVITSS